jgi:hypothetical protein
MLSYRFNMSVVANVIPIDMTSAWGGSQIDTGILHETTVTANSFITEGIRYDANWRPALYYAHVMALTRVVGHVRTTVSAYSIDA